LLVQATNLQAASEQFRAPQIPKQERLELDGTIELGADGYYHPTHEKEVVALINRARRMTSSIRVRGSGHSVPPAIGTDGRDASGAAIDVLLDRFIRVRFDDDKMQVTAQAGCHLGRDPRDHTGTSTWDNSLSVQLDRRGWALPDLGGVSHQTVAGFLLTGSAGGTVRHSLADSVVALRFVDGTGTVRELKRGTHPEFYALGCSLGLLGILLEVTFQCEPRYDVMGTETISPWGDLAFSVNRKTESNHSSVSEFLRDEEYCRFLWWPQAGVNRVVTWRARRMQSADYGDEHRKQGALRARPYRALGSEMKNARLARVASVAAQAAGGSFYDTVAATRQALTWLEGHGRAWKGLRRLSQPLFEHGLLPFVLRRFVPLDQSAPQVFRDSWYRALPMDNDMVEQLLPTTFTEVWVDLADAPEVMSLLRRHFQRHGRSATGDYVFEFYAARANQFWIHPGYERDSFRINVFWFERNRESAESFFGQFWELLAPFRYRLHWGKHLPNTPCLGPDYLSQQFPKWDEFLSLRDQLDPENIFLNDHWRKVFHLV